MISHLVVKTKIQKNMDIIKIGEYRLIPANTMVWSIAMQENISFEDDQIVEVTHDLSSVGKSDLFDGKIKLLFFKGSITGPGFSDKNNGDLSSVKISDTKKFIMNIGETLI